MNIEEYIKVKFPKTVRVRVEDEYPWFGLPKPYTVPCADGMFQEMYYWDSYFTNIGLLLDGDVEQAKNNVENLAYMAERFGFVPNGSRAEFLNNSQPPFMSQMAREVYEVTHDKEWLRNIYPAILTEYRFWTEKRGCPNGLCRYDAVEPISEEQVSRGSALLIERLGYTPPCDEYTLARGLFAVGESGWDVNPRMTYRAYDFNPAELNSLIYSMEKNLAFITRELDIPEWDGWESAAEARADACRKYLKGEDGVFYDYDMKNGCRQEMLSAASYYPLYFGMASDKEAFAAREKLRLLETDWGTVTTVPFEARGRFQWGYPNGWPPMQQIIVGGLLRYGYREDAYRLAEKFVGLVEKCFEDTGHLWEKYDIVGGTADAVVEYETPAMLGWTYGVYRSFKKILEGK